MNTYEVRIRFQAQDREDALQAIDGLEDTLESWEPPTWLASEPIEVRKDGKRPQCEGILNTTVYAGGKVYRKPGDRCSLGATTGAFCKRHAPSINGAGRDP